MISALSLLGNACTYWLAGHAESIGGFFIFDYHLRQTYGTKKRSQHCVPDISLSYILRFHTSGFDHKLYTTAFFEKCVEISRLIDCLANCD